MDKFKKTWSLKKKRETSTGESSKPHQWKEDEKKVREGCCSFQVKYLGCIEVFESRGIQVCEEAVKALKSRRVRKSIWSRISFRKSKKKKKDLEQQGKSSHHIAVLYVTGDALRVVDEISKGLIVDQTIEKVSFCAPDRDHDKGFAYICRDGTTRRWMCHGFLAVKESGERLSHAVGCAFAICLEKKQQREKEKVSVMYSDNGSSFSRLGSFKQTSLTERLADPQSAIVAEPVPAKQCSNPYAVSRPKAPMEILERQGSFNSFQKLSESSPFKRNVSLRLNDLPSNLERQHNFSGGLEGPQAANERSLISTIMESDEGEQLPNPPPSTSPTPSSSNAYQSTNVVTTIPQNFNYFESPPPATTSTMPSQQYSGIDSLQSFSTPPHFSTPSNFRQQSTHQTAQASAIPYSFHAHIPITQANSWNNPHTKATSEADNWLNSTANRIDPFAAAPNNSALLARSQNNITTPIPPFNQSNPSFQSSITQASSARQSFSSIHASLNLQGQQAAFPNTSIITSNPQPILFPQQQQQLPATILPSQQSIQQSQGTLIPQQNSAVVPNSLQQQIEQQQLIIQKLQEQLKLHDFQQQQQQQQNSQPLQQQNSQLQQPTVQQSKFLPPTTGNNSTPPNNPTPTNHTFNPFQPPPSIHSIR